MVYAVVGFFLVLALFMTVLLNSVVVQQKLWKAFVEPQMAHLPVEVTFKGGHFEFPSTFSFEPLFIQFEGDTLAAVRELRLERLAWSSALLLDRLVVDVENLTDPQHWERFAAAWAQLPADDGPAASWAVVLGKADVHVLSHTPEADFNLAVFGSTIGSAEISAKELSVFGHWQDIQGSGSAQQVVWDSTGHWAGQLTFAMERWLNGSLSATGSRTETQATFEVECTDTLWPAGLYGNETAAWKDWWNGAKINGTWERHNDSDRASLQVSSTPLLAQLEASTMGDGYALQATVQPTESAFLQTQLIEYQYVFNHFKPRVIRAKGLWTGEQLSDISLTLQEGRQWITAKSEGLDAPLRLSAHLMAKQPTLPLEQLALKATLQPNLGALLEGQPYEVVAVLPQLVANGQQVEGLSAHWLHSATDSLYLTCLDSAFDVQLSAASRPDSIRLQGAINRMNLQLVDPMDSGYVLSGGLNLQITPNALGTLRLDNVLLERPDQYVFLRELALKHTQGPKKHELALESDVLKASISGEWEFEQLPAVGTRMLGDLMADTTAVHEWTTARFSYELESSNIEWLAKLLHLNVDLSEGTSAFGHYDGRSQFWLSNAVSERLAYDNVRASGLNAQLVQRQQEQELRITLDSGKVNALQLERLRLNAKGPNSGRSFQLATTLRDSIDTQFKLDGKFTWGALTSDALEFNVGESHFSQQLPNTTRWDGKVVSLDGITLSGEHGFLSVYGALPLEQGQRGSLFLTARKFQSNVLNYLLRDPHLQLGGEISAQLQWTGGLATPSVTGSFTYANLALNDRVLGTLELSSTFSETLPTLPINGRLRNGNRALMTLQADYHPTTHKWLFNSAFFGTPIEPFNPFVEGVLDQLQGELHGRVQGAGTFANFTLDGELEARNAGFSVPIVGPLFMATEPIKVQISERSITIEPTKLVNPKDGTTASAYGSVDHRYFQNLYFDLKMQTDSLRAVDLQNSPEAYFYGTALVGGELQLQGPLEQLHLNLKLATKDGTAFKIPLDNPTGVESASYLRFMGNGRKPTAQTDSTAQAAREYFASDIIIQATPEARIDLVMDELLGDVISAFGQGNLRLKLLEDEQLELYGLYTVVGGSYLFTLQNIVNKPFVLLPGGSILWSGDLYEAEIDLEAKYQVRTNLSGLVTNASYGGEQVDVDLIIELTGGLMSPEIAFRIELPGSPAAYTAELNRRFLGADQINYQAFSLLMLGDFYRSDLGFQESFNLTQSVSNSTNEVLLNQFGHWLATGLGDFIDVELDYTQGNNPYQTLGLQTGDLLNLGVSKAFFDGRLKLNSSFDVPIGQGSTSTLLLGDTEVRYELTKDGKWFIKAFNKSNRNNPLLYTTGNYTQGVGIQFQRQFDRVLPDTKKAESDSTATQQSDKKRP